MWPSQHFSQHEFFGACFLIKHTCFEEPARSCHHVSCYVVVVHKSKGADLLITQRERLCCLQTVWERMCFHVVKWGCSARRVSTCPSACLVSIVYPRQWQKSGCSVMKRLTTTNMGDCRWRERQSSCQGQDATQHLWAETTDWAETIRRAALPSLEWLWMLSLSVLWQVLHWAVRLCAAVTQSRCCYHDDTTTKSTYAFFLQSTTTCKIETRLRICSEETLIFTEVT